MSEHIHLSALVKAQIDQLEKLERLQQIYCEVCAEERISIQENIDIVMDGIASLGRAIQNRKATGSVAQ